MQRIRVLANFVVLCGFGTACSADEEDGAGANCEGEVCDDETIRGDSDSEPVTDGTSSGTSSGESSSSDASPGRVGEACVENSECGSDLVCDKLTGECARTSWLTFEAFVYHARLCVEDGFWDAEVYYRAFAGDD